MNDEELKILVKERLDKMSIQIPKCKKCGADILFCKTTAGKWMPVTLSFISHFSDCPYANNFRKPKDETN